MQSTTAQQPDDFARLGSGRPGARLSSLKGLALVSELDADPASAYPPAIANGELIVLDGALMPAPPPLPSNSIVMSDAGLLLDEAGPVAASFSQNDVIALAGSNEERMKRALLRLHAQHYTLG
jgi:hypothetical protein